MRKTITIIAVILALGISGFYVIGRHAADTGIDTTAQNATSTIPATDIAHIEIGMDIPLISNNVMISVTKVIEDSRCPSDVQCIQAGTVRILLNTETPTGTSTLEMGLGETKTVDSLIFSLDDVKPYPISTKKISPADYKFTFVLI
jgi:hypothetical protein